ncbi:hypothetical protein [Zavarzinia compransoris]|uniref:Uncharacterized protein n=1 Tax=Zavarzinia compransoris TaxID=1264899 RepID=A0A317DZQ6_9PROT|nr:hypothetical protein [Zavarzinia compransoris]PWR19842.1 hypothetical protein DKG75_15410 [Zavarzinia compransoris]TDP45049.1 hypothetical protein DES42_106271 [Zavarzinia compransoris]
MTSEDQRKDADPQPVPPAEAYETLAYGYAEGGKPPPAFVRYVGYGLLALAVVSAVLVLYMVYGFGWAGVVGLLLTAGVGAAVGFGLTFIPVWRADWRKALRLGFASLLALGALWGTHGGVYGDARQKRATFEALAGAKTPAEARARLGAITTGNRYATFLVFAMDRAAATRASARTLLDSAQIGSVDWNIANLDPADKTGLTALHSRLLDSDVLLSGMPDQLQALYKREGEEIMAAAAHLELSPEFRANAQANMLQRQREYLAFYVALSLTTRKAVSELAGIANGLAQGKATRGADGKLVYGDDKTRATVEGHIAELDKARAAVVKLVEAAKLLDQKYDATGR